MANRSNRSSRGLHVFVVVFVGLLVFAGNAAAQGTPSTGGAESNPLTTPNKQFYGGMKDMLLRAAEKLPEEHYAFRPTAAVRTFGQIVGHVADTQYAMCSIVLAEKDPAPGIEKGKTAKADLIAALKGAFAYCDRAYNEITDATAVQTVKFMGRDNMKQGVLTANLIHSGLHYGNLVTYMRMKNVVPPTSEPGFFDPPKK